MSIFDIAARGLTVNEIDNRLNVVSTLRWITNGIQTPTGEVVRLKATKVGGSYRVLEADLEEFVAAVNGRTVLHAVAQPFDLRAIPQPVGLHGEVMA